VDGRLGLWGKRALPEGGKLLLGAVGYRVVALYGDYNYTAYSAEVSPYMIWVLERAWQQRSTGLLMPDR
jgi:hypothetical protein